jgi:hypothetical protein
MHLPLLLGNDEQFLLFFSLCSSWKGFLGQTVSRRAILEGYAVTSLSRRGKPPPSKKDEKSKDGGTTTAELLKAVDYRAGDAREKGTIEAILQEGGYAGMYNKIAFVPN